MSCQGFPHPPVPRRQPGGSPREEQLRVKICGLTRPVDARVAEQSGASYAGAVLVPGSPRRVSLSQASTLARAVEIPLVIVISDLGPDEAAAAAKRAGAGGIQLHGDESPEMVRELRGKGPWELWKAVRVRSRDDIVRALDQFGALVDLLLFDGWQADQLGGTGTGFSWEALDSVRGVISSAVRVGVAGGLSPENVEEAVTQLEPDLVDVSSGVESSPGTKDHERVRKFVRRALADPSGRVEGGGRS